MEQFKNIQCWQCRKVVRAKLHIGHRELLDGYHGECDTCGWLFESTSDNKGECGCRFENNESNSIILCDECSKLPCHNPKGE